MAKTTITGILLLSIWILVPETSAQNGLDGFAERIETERKAWDAPGLAIAVVHQDKVAFMSGFGKRDLESGEPVDEHTLFHVGSTTKAFTAAAIGLLVEEGKLGWQDKVIDHLPEFRVADPYVTRELTVLDLLTHRTGVQNTDLVWYRGVKTEDFLPRLHAAKQSSSLRSKFEYNNGMYIVAGKLIEAVSGKSYTQFVRERLFNPLGMDRTTGPLAEISKRSNVATSHEMVGDQMTPIGLTDVYDAGAAGLFYSSVSEYVPWLRVWLNHGKLGDQVILKRSTVRTAFKPHMVLPQPMYPAAKKAGVDLVAYGLGWFLHDYRGRRVNMHTGSLDGMSAMVALMPEEDLGVVIFINGDHIELRHALMYETFDRIIGGKNRDWSSELQKTYKSITNGADLQRAKRIKNIDPSAEPGLKLENYVGEYRHPVIGNLTVSMDDGQLAVAAPPLIKFDLKPAGDHKFIAYRMRRGFENESDIKKYHDPTFVHFEIDEKNRPKNIVLSGGMGSGSSFQRTLVKD